jgi:26S proteasome regulatory subunit N2
MLNTATTYLALLQEDDTDIKSVALDKINILVDDFWSEISDYIKDFENLYSNKVIPEKQDLIALILSKIYYNLEDYDSAIEWSLEAGTRFNLLEKSQYVNTILKKIMEKYIEIRKYNFFTKNEEKRTIDSRIASLMDRIFKKCLDKNEINQAIGFSLESYDLDRVIINFLN